MGPGGHRNCLGLTFSTILTLIVVPLLYRLFMTRSKVVARGILQWASYHRPDTELTTGLPRPRPSSSYAPPTADYIYRVKRHMRLLVSSRRAPGCAANITMR